MESRERVWLWIVAILIFPCFQILAAGGIPMTELEFQLRYGRFNVGSIRHLSPAQLTANQIVYDGYGVESRRAMLISRDNGLELIEGIVNMGAFEEPARLHVRGPFNDYKSEIIPTSIIVSYTLKPIDELEKYGVGPFEVAVSASYLQPGPTEQGGPSPQTSDVNVPWYVQCGRWLIGRRGKQAGG